MSQEWFEMPDIIRKDFNKSVWIPLRAVYKNEHEGDYGYVGYKEDFFGTGTIAVPVQSEEDAKKLEWMDIGIGHQHAGGIEDGAYIPADIYIDYKSKFEGVHLVLDQYSDGEETNVWHLHHDLVLTLGLIREGNSWLCPKDGYIEVAKLTKSDDGKPALLEIKAQYLKDYLCAREMGLYMTSFYSRDVVIEDASSITWKDGNSEKKNDSYSWEGRIIPIHEGGHPYGEKWSVFHVGRTDVDESDDVPDISSLPTDENTKHDQWERGYDGKKLYSVIGELWRNDWIPPGKESPKVRGDKIPSTVHFTIDADGSKASGKDLTNAGKWLWFKPDVIMALCHRRGGNLEFYTEETGKVFCSYGHGVHFGVNSLGYINVYAKDIGYLPEWQQQIWGGYNITPEGGVSKELLESQVKAEPANTQAPEEFLIKGIELVNTLSQEKLGFKLFREHELIPELITKIHRFRALDEASFYSLAKDLARITADSLDAASMQTIVPPPAKTQWGSLKSLENLLSSRYEKNFIRQILAPVVGVYELRHADAHLPSSEINDAFKLINIDRTKPFVHQGLEMLGRLVSSIYGIAKGLEKWQ